MNFDLPATGTEQGPAFLDAAACKDWLIKVPLANPAQAQAILLRQLNLLHRFSLTPADRFAILEALRGPVADVQEAAARQFVGKFVPLAQPEQVTLQTTLGIWHILALGYLRCFAASCADPDGKSPTPALAAQRTLSVFADWQLDLCRGAQLPDATYWTKLNQIFLTAESLDIAAKTVNDSLRHGKAATSALAAFCECKLLSAAGPYELPPRHLTWVARWARRWGAKLTLLTAPPEDIRNRAVPLQLDLESDHPAGHSPPVSSGGRWLETTELRKSLVARIALLDQGRAPAELQLGDDVTQPAAGHLLQRVLQRWCLGGAPRHHERRIASGNCTFIAGFDAVHYQLSGRQTFVAPSRDDATLRREREEFEVFGDRRNRDGGAAKVDESQIEKWQVMDEWRLINESAVGLRITRPLRKGVRVGAGLLVGIKTDQKPRLALGCLRWAVRDGDDLLAAGIQLFPGEARAVAVRILDPGETGGTWRQGFLLPEIVALKEPASVVVPAGTFRLDRSLEVMVDEELRVLKLFRVLDRGLEFERCNLYVYP